MISTWATLLACVTLVSALSNTAPASDVQRVVSHLQGLMPLRMAAVSERIKRQVQNESGTSDDQPPPPHMHFKYNKCCKKMPKIINMKSVRECFKSLRPVPPPAPGPGGPPPPSDSPGGPPPTGNPSGPLPTGNPRGPLPTGNPSGPLPTGNPSVPPPPPPEDLPLPPAEADGDEEFDENDVGETVETFEGTDAQNSSTSGQLRDRLGAKGHKCGRRADHRERMACAMECAFKKENLIKDGAVDQTAFAAYMDKYIQEKNATVWENAIDAALNNCSVSVPASIKHDQNCTSGSLEMVHCMSRQIFVNCPETNWKGGDEKCDACRTAQQNCWSKRDQRRWSQQGPRNGTQEVQA